MITLKSCPVCESSEIAQYHQFGVAPRVKYEIMLGVSVSAAILTTYFVCQSCHVIFQNPRMSSKELNQYYTNGYYRQMINLTEKIISEDEMYRAKFDSKIIKETVGKVESHVDIGCSCGYFLSEMGARLKVGVEPNINCIKDKGIKVYSKMSQIPKKKFELVSALHTLEHLPDPVRSLKEMIKFVDKNSHLVIEVPTWKSPGGPLRLSHLFHFEPDVLRLICQGLGLRVIETKFTPHLLLICKVAKE